MNVNPLEELWNDTGNNTERLVFFSDAIFAVALTLLVIDLRVPDVPENAPLLQPLLALWPNLQSLLISFFVISFYWIAHHRIFHLIEHYNRRLMGLNFLFLLGIVLQPFTTLRWWLKPTTTASPPTPRSKPVLSKSSHQSSASPTPPKRRKQQ